MPHNNAGVYLPNDSVSALEELRTRLEKLMLIDGGCLVCLGADE